MYYNCDVTYLCYNRDVTYLCIKRDVTYLCIKHDVIYLHPASTLRGIHGDVIGCGSPGGGV